MFNLFQNAFLKYKFLLIPFYTNMMQCAMSLLWNMDQYAIPILIAEHRQQFIVTLVIHQHQKRFCVRLPECLKMPPVTQLVSIT